MERGVVTRAAVRTDSSRFRRHSAARSRSAGPTFDTMGPNRGSDLEVPGEAPFRPVGFRAREPDRYRCLLGRLPTVAFAGRSFMGFTVIQAAGPGTLMPIAQVFDKLSNLVGVRIQATGPGQDRVRGELLQQRVSDELGIGEYANYGQWPDIVSQILEVKLQTSPTIDLGLILPSDTTPIRSLGSKIRHCDARYLVVYGKILASKEVEVHSLVLSTGTDFFDEFVQFGGLVKNIKRQIRLPSDLF